MLSHIHVDNFRCLVNFDLKLDRLNLLLGENGAGKTTVFDVLRVLQGFLGGSLNVDAAFPAQDLTRWQQLGIQNFELELKQGDDVYSYVLSIEHDIIRPRRRIKRETLQMNKRDLFDFQEGTAHLYRDNFTPGPEYPFDWSRSGIASLQARPENRLLSRFREQIARMVIVSPCPVVMLGESREENSYLARWADNFSSWYRYVSQEHQGNVLELTQQLRKVLPAFDSFSLREAGEKARVLKVIFRSAFQGSAFQERESPGLTTFAPGTSSSSSSMARYPYPIEYNFDELSDGQRQLIVLYSLLYVLRGEGYSLFLDEPDNYVALREIQPWLTSVEDACGDSISQAVLISHNPQIIDYLSGAACRWFDRPDNGPTRVMDQSPRAAEGLKTSETIARGLNS